VQMVQIMIHPDKRAMELDGIGIGLNSAPSGEVKFCLKVQSRRTPTSRVFIT
jgi:hypothetical protein